MFKVLPKDAMFHKKGRPEDKVAEYLVDLIVPRGHELWRLELESQLDTICVAVLQCYYITSWVRGLWIQSKIQQ